MNDPGCKCDTAAWLDIEKDHVGHWVVQILYCENCGNRVRTIINHLAEHEGASDVEESVADQLGAVSDGVGA